MNIFQRLDATGSFAPRTDCQIIGTALALGLGIASAAGAIGGGAIAAHGASSAANTQASAAEQAAQLQHEDAQAALDFNKQQYADQQKNIAPFLEAGQGAVKTLSGLVPSLTAPYPGTWTAPTAVTEQNDPGFQFRLAEGEKALQASAAAKGDLLTGGTAKALNRYGQDYGSNEYSNVYNRSFNDFTANYNQFKQQQADTYNRYANLAGLGTTASGQLGAAGNAATGNNTNILLSSGAQQAQALNNAAAARASGYVGTANAYGGAFNSIGNNVSSIALLKSLYGGMNPYSAQALNNYPIPGTPPLDSSLVTDAGIG